MRWTLFRKFHTCALLLFVFNWLLPQLVYFLFPWNSASGVDKWIRQPSLWWCRSVPNSRNLRNNRNILLLLVTMLLEIIALLLLLVTMLLEIVAPNLLPLLSITK